MVAGFSEHRLKLVQQAAQEGSVFARVRGEQSGQILYLFLPECMVLLVELGHLGSQYFRAELGRGQRVRTERRVGKHLGVEKMQSARRCLTTNHRKGVPGLIDRIFQVQTRCLGPHLKSPMSPSECLKLFSTVNGGIPAQ